MQIINRKSINKTGEKKITIPRKQTERLHKLFGVSQNSVYNALRYETNSERSQAIREAAFNTGKAKVEIVRPMSQYDIYISKELADPSATKQD